MSDQIISSIVTIAVAIIAIAGLAVVVSRQAQTTQVLSAGGSAFANTLGVALSPVTGGSSSTPFNFNAGAGTYNYQ
jgi:hypothetical protein